MTSLFPPLRRLTAGLVLAGAGFFPLSPSASAQVPASILDEDSVAATTPPIKDKFEGFNRGVFKFNHGFYRVVWRPLSRGYTAVVPRPARRGLGNFFHNLAYPTRLLGNVLEGHARGAFRETGRFLVNTTAGLGGLFAVADKVPALRGPEADLGLAFATWGAGHGTYLVLPIIGPTSLRDGFGDLVSAVYLDPVQYLDKWKYRTAATGLNYVNQSPDAMHSYDTLTNAAIDPYVALRDAFNSRRAQQVRDQQAPLTPPPMPPADAKP